MRRRFEGNALVYCDKGLGGSRGASTRELLRKCCRYRVLAVVDASTQTGGEYGQLATATGTIPVVSTLAEGIAEARRAGFRPTNLIVGLGSDDIQLSNTGRETILDALRWGLDIVHWLQGSLGDINELQQARRQAGTTIRNLSKSRSIVSTTPRDAFEFVRSLRIAVLGASTGYGAAELAISLSDQIIEAGYRAQLIATGPMAWLQGACHGSVFDTVPLRRIADCVERSLIEAWHQGQPDCFVIECPGPLFGMTEQRSREFLRATRPRVVLLHSTAQLENGFTLNHMIEAIREETDSPTIAVVLDDSVDTNEKGRQRDQVGGAAAVPVFNSDAAGLLALIETLGLQANQPDRRPTLSLRPVAF